MSRHLPPLTITWPIAEMSRTNIQSLEARVLLKHKEMFTISEDCLDILANLLKFGLINETQARNISSTVVDTDDSENKRNG